MAFYTFLYALSVVAINPWGSTQREIWVVPKVLVLVVLLLQNGVLIFRHARAVKVDGIWRRAAYLWFVLLAVGLVSTVLSPAPRRSLFGQSIYGDGWLYWLLVAGLVLTNALAIRAKPEAFKAQLRGLLLGGAVFALSIFPQLMDKSIDYTVTTGQFVAGGSERLLSGVHVNHQPVGFTSHRGHASVVLALTSLLALATSLKRWLKPWLVWPTFFVASLALWFTDSRGGLLAGLLGLLYLAWYALRTRRGRRVFGATLLLLVLSGGAYTLLQREADIQVRELPHLDTGLNTVTSSRSVLWLQALWAIGQRPLLGYGFSGFGTAQPSIHARTDPRIQEVLQIDDFYYTYSDGEQIREGHIEEFYNKAHNIVLDWLLNVGIVGFLVYAALMLYLLAVTFRSAAAPLEVLTVAYLGFTLTWYDAAQFTHLGFWGLSVGLGFYHTSTRTVTRV